jgi:hypothetical protein
VQKAEESGLWLLDGSRERPCLHHHIAPHALGRTTPWWEFLSSVSPQLSVEIQTALQSALSQQPWRLSQPPQILLTVSIGPISTLFLRRVFPLMLQIHSLSFIPLSQDLRRGRWIRYSVCPTGVPRPVKRHRHNPRQCSGIKEGRAAWTKCHRSLWTWLPDSFNSLAPWEIDGQEDRRTGNRASCRINWTG